MSPSFCLCSSSQSVYSTTLAVEVETSQSSGQCVFLFGRFGHIQRERMANLSLLSPRQVFQVVTQALVYRHQGTSIWISLTCGPHIRSATCLTGPKSWRQGSIVTEKCFLLPAFQRLTFQRNKFCHNRGLCSPVTTATKEFQAFH